MPIIDELVSALQAAGLPRIRSRRALDYLEVLRDHSGGVAVYVPTDVDPQFLRRNRSRHYEIETYLNLEKAGLMERPPDLIDEGKGEFVREDKWVAARNYSLLVTSEKGEELISRTKSKS